VENLELIHALVFIRYVIHNNSSKLCWFIQISALSTFDGRIEAYHGFDG
jgi:hypothetical protein